MACASVLSQYSPFFTSGLLTSTLPREASSKPARRSDPLTVNTTNIYSNSRAPRSAVDLSHRDRLQSGHSFLTLDITEPPRGNPSPSRRTLTSQRSVPILRQSARENPRIPSPKPAPSVSLPAIPQESLRDSTSVSECSQAGPSQHLSIPTSASTPTADESYLFISPLASPRLTSSRHPSRALPPLRLPPLISQNRSAALAALEGRSSRDHMDVSSKARNFMNMSDDEEDLSESQERVPSSYFEDDSDDEDDDEFFSFPESSVLPTSLPPWQTNPTSSPKRPIRNITSYSPPPASFIDFGDVDEYS